MTFRRIVVILVVIWIMKQVYNWIWPSPVEHFKTSYKEQWNQDVEKAYTKQDHLELAWLYHNAPIQRVNSINTAIEHYNGALVLGSTEALYQLGKIYLHGIPEVLDPDLDKAEKCFRQLYSTGDNWQRALAHDALDYLMNEYKSKYGSWVNLHRQWEPEITRQVKHEMVAPVIIQLHKTTEQEPLRYHQKRNNKQQNQIHRNTTQRQNQHTDAPIQPTRRVKPPVNHKRRTTFLSPIIHDIDENNGNLVNIRNDQHNVHDTGVVNSIKVTINKLHDTTDQVIDKERAVSDIRSYIQECSTLNETQREYANKVLDRMESNNDLITSVDKKETDILQIVYNRIKHPDNSDNQQTLMENLVENLAASVENENIVCPSGRVSRLVDALNTIDTHVSIKPDWAFRQEMLGRASKLRQELLEKQDESTQNDIDQGIERPEFDNLYKHQLLTEFQRDYVDTGLLSDTKLQAELDQWIDHVV